MDIIANELYTVARTMLVCSFPNLYLQKDVKKHYNELLY